jgi:hypothetical protein
MANNTSMTTALLPLIASNAAAHMWQTPEVSAYAYPATRVFAGHSAGTGIGGFEALAVIADKHSRQAKPAAPPRGLR